MIVADSNYHALGLYESLGFERREHALGVWRVPREDMPRNRLPNDRVWQAKQVTEGDF